MELNPTIKNSFGQRNKKNLDNTESFELIWIPLKTSLFYFLKKLFGETQMSKPEKYIDMDLPHVT